MAAVLGKIRRCLGLRKELLFGGRVLDIGCGARKRGSVGIDIQETASVDVLADGRRLPFATDSFDAVVCYHLLEHLEEDDIKRLLAEIARVLHPRGRAYLLIDRDSSREALLSKDATHVERYPRQHLYDIISESLSIRVFQSHNLLGNLIQHPLTWWRYLGRGTKVYAEATPR